MGIAMESFASLVRGNVASYAFGPGPMPFRVGHSM
jgi:hypothetical protein